MSELASVVDPMHIVLRGGSVWPQLVTSVVALASVVTTATFAYRSERRGSERDRSIRFLDERRQTYTHFVSLTSATCEAAARMVLGMASDDPNHRRLTGDVSESLSVVWKSFDDLNRALAEIEVMAPDAIVAAAQRVVRTRVELGSIVAPLAADAEDGGEVCWPDEQANFEVWLRDVEEMKAAFLLAARADLGVPEAQVVPDRC